MKHWVIWSCTWLIALSVGCDTGRRAAAILETHRAAIDGAAEHISRADAHLQRIVSPPPEVGQARDELGKASSKLDEARGAASKLHDMVIAEAEKNKRLRDNWLSPKMRNAVIVTGSIVALAALILVFVRWGGIGGTLVSLPLVGSILSRLLKIRK